MVKALKQSRKIFPRGIMHLICSVMCIAFFSCGSAELAQEEDPEAENARARDSMEFEMLKDPALGYVPYHRLHQAKAYINTIKNTDYARNSSFAWIERGPIYQMQGFGFPANEGHTSGRVRAILMDTLNDPSGNTVLVGGVTGGLWKCTNFLSAVPNWQLVTDYDENVCVASICQNPVDPRIMYISTGEAYSTVTSGEGRGIWKSVDAGATWTFLPATARFERSTKIICDAEGNVYAAVYSVRTFPSVFGLFRSNDNGNTWTDISPLVPNISGTCADLKFSSTGRLHAAFGFRSDRVHHFYTDDPATVTRESGWFQGAGIPPGAEGAPFKTRIELACLEDTLYAAIIVQNNVEELYKSIDGGANWTLQNIPEQTRPIAGGQGDYNLVVSINPDSTNQVIVGGIFLWLSKNSGQTFSAYVTNFGSNAIHADQHFVQWFRKGNERWMLVGNDGGVYFSRDGGKSFKGKNRNLSLKQFYACSMHPAAGSNYYIAGSQDNGNHRFVNPGLSYSEQITGGDGGYSHINQLNPQIQFAASQNTAMNMSTNGGAHWSLTFLPSRASFINPFTYDDASNILYSAGVSNSMNRWVNAHITLSGTAQTISFNPLPGGTVSALKMSAFTPNRLFVGTGTRLYRLENAHTVTTATVGVNMTNIGSSSFTGYLRCINTGTSDDNMVVVFSNFGVNNLWHTKDGGASWSAIDGNLPDLPVLWAVFEPGSNTRIVISTEAGIFSTDHVNGPSTIWIPHTGVPLMRVTMLQARPADKTIIASTYGRGLFSAIIPTAAFPVKLIDFAGKLQGNDILLTWQTATEQNNKGFEIERSPDGINFKKIGFVAGAGNNNMLRSYSFTDKTMDQTLNYYRLRQIDNDHTAEYSPIILVKYPSANNRFITAATLSRSGVLELQLGKIESGNGEIRLINLSGQSLLRWNSMLNPGARLRLQVPSHIPQGLYAVHITQKNKKYTAIVEKK